MGKRKNIIPENSKIQNRKRKGGYTGLVQPLDEFQCRNPNPRLFQYACGANTTTKAAKRAATLRQRP